MYFMQMIILDVEPEYFFIQEYFFSFIFIQEYFLLRQTFC